MKVTGKLTKTEWLILALTAAFLAALLKGKSHRECARYASAASAIKCTRIGGRAGIPDEAVLERFLETGEIDYEEIDRRVEYYRRALEHV